ncbi:ribosome biogenesis protein Nop16 [Limtongia smithiae]|uniref:ribosome biogenesis protein Nop16 n=1 Tax=Limtongia smithiae TaxID=1125753 RepID=UPI0034CD2B81
MTSVRRRRKQKANATKVTRRTNDKRRKVRIKSNAIIAANWDEKLTLSQNYKKLGLTSRLSRPSGGVEKELKPAVVGEDALFATPSDVPTIATTPTPAPAITEARIIRDPVTGATRVEYITPTAAANFNDDDEAPLSALAPASADTDVVRQLQELADRGERSRPRTQSDREEHWLRELIARYGDDYVAMSRDRRRNIWQQTPADIRRRVSRLRKCLK